MQKILNLFIDSINIIDQFFAFNRAIFIKYIF